MPLAARLRAFATVGFVFLLAAGCESRMSFMSAGEVHLDLDESVVVLEPLHKAANPIYVGRVDTEEHTVLVFRDDAGTYAFVATEEAKRIGHESRIREFSRIVWRVVEAEVDAMEVATFAGLIEEQRGGAAEVPFTLRLPNGTAAHGVFRRTTRPATAHQPSGAAARRSPRRGPLRNVHRRLARHRTRLRVSTAATPQASASCSAGHPTPATSNVAGPRLARYAARSKAACCLAPPVGRITALRPEQPAGVIVACRAVHFSLDADQVAAMKAVDEQERVDYVQETFEEKLWSVDASRAQETDKAWDAIHRSLTDGKLGWDNGSYPLNHVILGGELLYQGSDYILSLKSPEQVRDIAAAIPAVTKESLRGGYESIKPSDYGMPLSDDDFEYTWEWFQGLVEFYQRAAAAKLFVLFTVDQ